MSSQWVTAVTRSFAMGCVAALVVGALWAPPAIAASGGAPLGPAPPAQRVNLVLPLKVDASGLEQEAMAVSTPGSPEYREYESVATTARRFGASPLIRRRVLSWLLVHGATGVRIDATGLFAQATMDLGQAERLFATPVMRFRAADGTQYVAPTLRVRVPRALQGAVEGIVGLDTSAVLAPSDTAAAPDMVDNAAAAQPSSQVPRTGTPAGCADGASAGEVGGDPSTGAFTPNQYLTAYGIDVLHNNGLLGQGQRVALIEADGVKTSDVDAFAECFGLPVPPIRQFAVASRKLRPPDVEGALDAEILDAAAPGLSEIDVYEAAPDVADFLAALAAPLQHPQSIPATVSVSLGICEPRVRAALGVRGLQMSQLVLDDAASSGVTILAASGDTGSAACQGQNGVPQDRLAILYPASSWFVTAVGGTNLILTPSNDIAAEVVWNDTSQHLGAGGGGLSSIWTRPPFQNGFVSSNSRAVPDVSMLADTIPGYAIFCTTADCQRVSGGSPWVRIGGTSAATPLFAGGIALVNGLLHSLGYEYLGLLNPFIYQLAQTSLAGAVFNDVQEIGNDVGPYIPGGSGQPLGCCTAGPGYDTASGLGSVNLTALASVVANIAPTVFPKGLASIGLAVPPGQHPVHAKQLVTRLSCSRACYARAEAVIGIAHGGEFDVVSGLFHLRAGGSRKIVLKFTPAQAARLQSALAHHKQIDVLVIGDLSNSAGKYIENSAPHEFTITG